MSEKQAIILYFDLYKYIKSKEVKFIFPINWKFNHNFYLMNNGNYQKTFN